METHPEADHVETLRGWLLAVLALGLAGTVTELILLEHYEQPLQLIPIALILMSAAAFIAHLLRPNATSLNAILVIMALFVLAGCIGFVAHFYGSAEFQLDLDPSMSRWELVKKVLHAKAPPLLAPGMMLQMGLLGLGYVFSDRRYRRSSARLLGLLRFKGAR